MPAKTRYYIIAVQNAGPEAAASFGGSLMRRVIRAEHPDKEVKPHRAYQVFHNGKILQVQEFDHGGVAIESEGSIVWKGELRAHHKFHTRETELPKDELPIIIGLVRDASKKHGKAPVFAGTKTTKSLPGPSSRPKARKARKPKSAKTPASKPASSKPSKPASSRPASSKKPASRKPASKPASKIIAKPPSRGDVNPPSVNGIRIGLVAHKKGESRRFAVANVYGTKVTLIPLSGEVQSLKAQVSDVERDADQTLEFTGTNAAALKRKYDRNATLALARAGKAARRGGGKGGRKAAKKAKRAAKKSAKKTPKKTAKTSAPKAAKKPKARKAAKKAAPKAAKKPKAAKPKAPKAPKAKPMSDAQALAALKKKNPAAFTAVKAIWEAGGKAKAKAWMKAHKLPDLAVAFEDWTNKHEKEALALIGG